MSDSFTDCNKNDDEVIGVYCPKCGNELKYIAWRIRFKCETCDYNTDSMPNVYAAIKKVEEDKNNKNE